MRAKLEKKNIAYENIYANTISMDVIPLIGILQYKYMIYNRYIMV